VDLQNEEGVPQRFYGKWHIMCMDSPYRQYVLAMMDEVFSRYEADELFLDIFGIQFYMYYQHGLSPFCFCQHTEKAWNTEFPETRIAKASRHAKDGIAVSAGNSAEP